MSAWRQPLLWVVVALPLATVAAGVATFRIAAAGPDAREDQAVRRTAQSQVEDIAPDLAAARAGLAATLVADREHGTLAISMAGTVAPARLVLRHPVDAARDLELAPERDGTQWLARSPAPLAGTWRIELHGRDGAWRLDGRLARDASTARLVPRFDVAQR